VAAEIENEMDSRLSQLEAELETLRRELDAAHEKQRAGDEIFRRFSDSGILGIALFELSGKLLFANEALLRMIGSSAEAMAAGTVRWNELTPPEWSARAAEAFAELSTRGSCAPHEREYLRCDGTRFWALFTGVRMDGQTAVAFLLDVTQRKRAEEALRFQARLLDAVEQAVIATDLEGTITYWNQFAGQLYGWSAEDVIGRNILDVTPAGGSRGDAAGLMAQLRTGQSWSGEMTVQRKDGSTFTAWVTDSPIYDSTGALVGIVGVSSDITARKQTEQALRTSENRFRTMFDQSPLSMQVFAPDGSHLAANPAWQTLWDATPDQLVGYNILQDPQARAKGSLPYIERAFRGESVTAPPILYDPAEIGRKGRPRWIEAYLYPVKEGAGEIREVVVLLYDVTGRIEVEQERARFLAREQEARARAEEAQRRLGFLAEATGALLGSLNLERVLAEILSLACRLVTADAYAVWRLDPAAARWTIAASQGLSQQYQTLVIDSLRHSTTMPGEPLVVSDVTQAPLLAGHRPLLDAEGIRAMLVLPLMRHSTVGGTLAFYYHNEHEFDEIELKVSTALANLAASAIATAELYEAAHQRADQLAEADRLKDQFLAMLAHELRNPLSAISNAVEVTHYAPAGTPAFQRAGEVIERQSRHMAHLVDQLLDVSRISRGKIELHPQRLDLVDLLYRTCEDHRHVLEAARVSLTVELPDTPLWVDGDPTRLRQALGNLLQNAAKFTDPGGHVTVRATSAPPHPRADDRLAADLPSPAAPVESGEGLSADSRRPTAPEESGSARHLAKRHADEPPTDAVGGRPSAVVTVSDTGIGIPPELLPHLFEPFVQADSSLDRARGGLGLGLALVKGIAELHGGRVQVRSEGIGRGAVFAFELPLQPASTHAAAHSATGRVEAEPLRILIIEDNVDAAETLRDLLQLLGHQAAVTHTGPTGVEMARQLRPDIVLCDLGLPGMDGYAVAAALRRDRAAAAARLIAVSGYGQEEDIRRCVEAGFDAHLTKPVEFGTLQRILETSRGR
jgi:PAS domain S-box-containing protein